MAPDRRLLAAAAVLLVAAGGLGAVALLTPPPDHVASGCFWWTATPVDRVQAGDRGCFRGYFVSGGGLADSANAPSAVLHVDFPTATCPMRPGDAVVVRGQAVFGEGRTAILADACR